MTELFKDLNARAAERGLTLTEVCREQQITPSAIWRWKTKVPATLENYFKILRTLAEPPRDTPTEGEPPRNPTPQPRTRKKPKK